MKQTAVEWLMSDIFPSQRLSPFYKQMLDKAKEMEEKQRQEDTNHGYSQGYDDGIKNLEPMKPELLIFTNQNRMFISTKFNLKQNGN